MTKYREILNECKKSVVKKESICYIMVHMFNWNIDI